jgi:hypothetical protein
MTIIAHKWKAQWNCTCIEKFYYTKDGHHCGIVDQQSPEFKPEFTWYEGRIMLDRGREGRFFVDWATGERDVKSSSLAELRQGIVNFLDGIRTQSDVSDIDTWESCIYWSSWSPHSGATPQKVRVKRDEKGVIRYAAWDAKRKEFVVGPAPYNVNLNLEPYTATRWKEVLADVAVSQAYHKAEHAFESELVRFSGTQHEPVLLQVMKAQTKTFDKHRKTLEARLDVLQRKEKEKKESKP